VTVTLARALPGGMKRIANREIGNLGDKEFTPFDIAIGKTPMRV
jgi:hypothetical protein